MELNIIGTARKDRRQMFLDAGLSENIADSYNQILPSVPDDGPCGKLSPVARAWAESVAIKWEARMSEATLPDADEIWPDWENNTLISKRDSKQNVTTTTILPPPPSPVDQRWFWVCGFIGFLTGFIFRGFL